MATNTTIFLAMYFKLTHFNSPLVTITATKTTIFLAITIHFLVDHTEEQEYIPYYGINKSVRWEGVDKTSPIRYLDKPGRSGQGTLNQGLQLGREF